MEELRRKPGEDGVREVEMNFKKRVARGLDPARWPLGLGTLFLVFSFGLVACGTLRPRPGIEPGCPTLQGRFSTTGPPGKSSLHH